MTPIKPVISTKLRGVIDMFEQRRIGQSSNAVTVVLNDNSLQIARHGVIAPTHGDDQMSQTRREQLTATIESLHDRIQRHENNNQLEPAEEFDLDSGVIVHAFDGNEIIQVNISTRREPSQSTLKTTESDLDKNCTANQCQESVAKVCSNQSKSSPRCVDAPGRLVKRPEPHESS